VAWVGQRDDFGELNGLHAEHQETGFGPDFVDASELHSIRLDGKQTLADPQG
jgi:hypothetical protein